MLEVITSKKVFYPVVGVLVTVLIGVAGYFVYQHYNVNSKKKETVTTTQSGTTSIKTGKKDKAVESPPQGTLRIIAAGDFLPHDSVNQNAKKGGDYDYLQFMKNLKPFFDKADLRFCVQAVPAGGEGFGISGYPVFNAPTQFTRDMSKLGCNVINSGSNHTNDKGQKLINATLNEWDKYDGILAVAGANRSPDEQKKLRTFEKDGVKFAFLSYVTYSNTKLTNDYGVNNFNEATAKADLKLAREQADIVMVSMRWGTEYSPDINAKQASQAKFLADNGADIVFGHGQHVQGPVKRLPKAGGGETIVWYGIGNFINTQLETETLFNGMPVLELDKATKKITKLSFIPFYMHYEWTASEKATGNLSARKNLGMYTFDEAPTKLKKAQLNTTVPAQKDRLSKVLNKYTEIEVE